MMIVCACVQAAKDRLLGEKDVTIQQLRSEISEKGRMLGEMDRLLRENAVAIAEKDRLLCEKDTTIAEKERQVSQVSVCWDCLIALSAVPSISHSASLITRMAYLLSCAVQMVTVALHEFTVVLCVVLSSSCVVWLCVCRWQRSAHCNHRCVVMLPLYALLRVCLGW
jgi:hypothetical protein